MELQFRNVYYYVIFFFNLKNNYKQHLFPMMIGIQQLLIIYLEN